MTEKGLAVATQVDRLISQWVGFGGDGLTDEERTIFYRCLDQISSNLKESLDGK